LREGSTSVGTAPSDGRVLDLFWTVDRKEAVYRNIHARESLDHGRTWSPIWDTGVPGQPAPAVPLSDGSLAMVYVDRSGAPEIKMRVSHDRGRTWLADSEIVLERPQLANQSLQKSSMQDAWSEMAAFSLGLPATAVAGNGDIVAVYYSGLSTDQTEEPPCVNQTYLAPPSASPVSTSHTSRVPPHYSRTSSRNSTPPPRTATQSHPSHAGAVGDSPRIFAFSANFCLTSGYL
jgi:hypothetical protein